MATARAQIGFFVDATRCINCKTCEIACKDFNDSPVGRRIRKVRSFEGGEFPAVFAYNVSMSCNHCEEPACVKGCPAGAYSKRAGDGIANAICAWAKRSRCAWRRVPCAPLRWDRWRRSRRGRAPPSRYATCPRRT